jgi:hypothetical protein
LKLTRSRSAAVALVGLLAVASIAAAADLRATGSNALAPLGAGPDAGGSAASASGSALPEASAVPSSRIPASGRVRSRTVITCKPGDQWPYVHDPSRLARIAPCLRVKGRLVARIPMPDGDIHLLIHVDAPYAYLLNRANLRFQHGDLVVESVCVNRPATARIRPLCARDPDPIRRLPAIGQHVWIDGAAVLDDGHVGWVELHPLYRWGLVAA